MNSDVLMAIGVVACIAVAGYALFRFRGPRPPGVAALGSGRPISIIDAYDSAGREAAARHVEEALGKYRAQRFAEDIGKALNVIERPAPGATPPPPPNA